jgi:magnesium chelatase family protein
MFDLPIAVAVLTALGEVGIKGFEDTLFVGELSLDGGVKQIPGVLPIVMEAKKKGCRRCVVPKENQKEGELVEGIQVIGVDSLEEVWDILKGKKITSHVTVNRCLPLKAESYPDFSDIKGQSLVKRAVEIAVAGGHNILMIGPPGAGKTAIAKRIPGILPPLTLEESLELTKIYSILGKVEGENPLIRERPFREVNPSVTQTALLGGGVFPRPGEISLADKGVLFLDEIAEFPKGLLETLRQPLEERAIRIIREKGEYYFPAEFLLVAAMNPCPCGNYPDFNRCTCTHTQIRNYLGKLSQPLLDRIDLCVEVPKVQYDALVERGGEETSDAIRERVIRAREVQRQRYKGNSFRVNARLPIQQIEQVCRLDSESVVLMEQAYEKLGLTARTYHKVLGVARTIADLECCESIQNHHLREALSYRTMDVKYRR